MLEGREGGRLAWRGLQRSRRGKAEVRRPKAERRPKSETRNYAARRRSGLGAARSGAVWQFRSEGGFRGCGVPPPRAGRFGLRISAFFRPSAFGFRICPALTSRRMRTHTRPNRPPTPRCLPPRRAGGPRRRSPMACRLPGVAFRPLRAGRPWRSRPQARGRAA